MREVTAQAIRESSSAQQEALGARARTPDGREFVYAKAGGSALAAGKLAVNADEAANHVNIAVAAAAAVGATRVKVTLGATAATANQYKDGFLTINDAAGEGTSYLISGHAAAGSAAALWVNLDEPIKVALTTSSEASLHSPFSGLVISATDQADVVIGVPNIPVAASEFAWFQTRGLCAVLADEAVAKGSNCKVGAGVAGAVETQDADDTTQTVGVALQALVDTEYRPIFLTIS